MPKAKRTVTYAFFLPTPDYDELNNWMCQQPGTIPQTVIKALELLRASQQSEDQPLTVEVTDEKTE